VLEDVAAVASIVIAFLAPLLALVLVALLLFALFRFALRIRRLTGRQPG
jgi:ABC-type spermidine/putrescine transport system permease subunit II